MVVGVPPARHVLPQQASSPGRAGHGVARAGESICVRRVEPPCSSFEPLSRPPARKTYSWPLTHRQMIGLVSSGHGGGDGRGGDSGAMDQDYRDRRVLRPAPPASAYIERGRPARMPKCG